MATLDECNARLGELKSKMKQVRTGDATIDELRSVYNEVMGQRDDYRSIGVNMRSYTKIVGNADEAIKYVERGMNEAIGEPARGHKRFIPAAVCTAATVAILGTIGYKIITNAEKNYRSQIAATEQKVADANETIAGLREELKGLSPPVGKLRILPILPEDDEDERGDGEYFFSSNARETISLVYQKRPHGAYLFQGISLKDHSWYFEVTSNGDMQLCVNFKDYNIEQRQKLIAAARKSGFAFGFRENADGTGIYDLIINGNGAEERGYKFDITNTSPGAGNLGLSGEGAIEKLITKRKKQIEEAEAARKITEPVAEPNEPAPEPREPADVNEPETTTRRYLDLPDIDSEPNQPR